MVRTHEEIENIQDLKNNQLLSSDRAFHDWYRFVLSYPPQLVRGYIEKFELNSDTTILDPFCGTGTTIVEAKKNFIPAIGVEANPMSYLASATKIEWNLDPIQLRSQMLKILDLTEKIFNSSYPLKTFSAEQHALILKNSIGEKPLHKCLILLDAIQSICWDEQPHNQSVENFFRLGLAYVTVNDASNLKFGPEVGIRRKKRDDVAVFAAWQQRMELMIADMTSVQGTPYPTAICHHADARQIQRVLELESIDAIITSPPYPNEKDYTRTTRLESVLLGLFKTKKELREFKQNLMRSNTRNVYVADDDDTCLSPHSEVLKIAQEIERRRLAMNKTSGFERLYHRATTLYFGGMKRHLAELRPFLRPGAKLAYVVGDQASYLQVLIRTGELLADIAQELGYQVLDIELFRTRIATATGEQLREEVLVLTWPSTSHSMRSRQDSQLHNAHDTPLNDHIDICTEQVFFAHYQAGDHQVYIPAHSMQKILTTNNISPPLTPTDLFSRYRHRRPLPAAINAQLTDGEFWMVRSHGRGNYCFERQVIQPIYPIPGLDRLAIRTNLPTLEASTGQDHPYSLVALLHQTGLLEHWLGYPGQLIRADNLPGTMMLYHSAAIATTGLIVPVYFPTTIPFSQQLIQTAIATLTSHNPDHICRPIAVQWLADQAIALFEFAWQNGEITIRAEKHYQIVPHTELSEAEIIASAQPQAE